MGFATFGSSPSAFGYHIQNAWNIGPFPIGYDTQNSALGFWTLVRYTVGMDFVSKAGNWLVSGYSLGIEHKGREVVVFPIWFNFMSPLCLGLVAYHAIAGHWF